MEEPTHAAGNENDSRHGAGSGIGRELILQLLKRGANVAGVDINQTSLEDTQRIAGIAQDRLTIVALDITNKEIVAGLPNEVVNHFGAVDGIINNAGIIQHFKPVSELSILLDWLHRFSPKYATDFFQKKMESLHSV